ncbi:hypothetical protein LSCM1_01015 [Leishmania martiniquensis]|uniref:Transmembrane protein n=1 Tax=Leishmania martiniquensis TaxID=1580590 RepID=A0A836KIG5_9TRYP|nr:hypothetical protein LSCM1_01015 [Leishmania martiniquensis]
MRQVRSSALRRYFAGGAARLAAPCVQASPALVVPRRERSSFVPSADGSAGATCSPAEHVTAGAARDTPELDRRAAEEVRVAQELGEQAFGENTEILKKVAVRGLRAFFVCAVGVVVLMWTMKKRKQELVTNVQPADGAASGALAEEADDPTQRYLQEMRGLGFDVDTLEEELKQERLANAAAKRQRARQWL